MQLEPVLGGELGDILLIKAGRQGDFCKKVKVLSSRSFFFFCLLLSVLDTVWKTKVLSNKSE